MEQRLREHADSLDDIDSLGPLQRIHGELTLDHITVGTAEGPRVISFAVTPDEPRPVEIDLVAMLRSIDYAAGYAWLQRTGSLAEGEPRIRALAIQGLEDTELRDDYLAAPEHLWCRQTANSFLSGYGHALGETKSVTDPLLRAALIDRLLVEVVSEMRDRPAWLIVPLAALAATLGDSHQAELSVGGRSVDAGPAVEGSDSEGSASEDMFGSPAGAAPDDDGAAGDVSIAEVAEGADILPSRSAVEDDRVGDVEGIALRRAPGGPPSAPQRNPRTNSRKNLRRKLQQRRKPHCQRTLQPWRTRQRKTLPRTSSQTSRW